MSVFAAQNMMSVLVGKNINRAGTQYTDSGSAGYIADGEILCLGSDGSVVTAPTYPTHPKIRFVQRSGSDLRFSPWIPGTGIVKYKGADGTVKVEQVTYVGYNGSTGSIDDASTDPYKLGIEFTFDESLGSLQSFSPVVCTPYDVASPTEIGIAMHFMAQINANASPRPAFGTETPLVVATVLSAHAGTAIGGAGDTVAGKAGTKTVTITDASTTSVALSAGDLIRIGTATTSNVYEVYSSSKAAGTSGTVILTTPILTTFSLAGNASEYITAAQAAASAAGVVITAQELPWNKDYFKYLQVMFKVHTENFLTTTMTETAPTRPNGYYKQIAELEAFSKGFDGALNRMTIPLPSVNFDTLTSGYYDVVTLSYYDDSNSTPIAGPARMAQQLIIAVVDDGANPVANQMNEILDALDAWVATIPNTQAAQLGSVAG